MYKFLESPEAKEENLTLGHIEVFVFMPDSTGYFVKADGMIFCDGLPQKMEEDILTHAGKSGIRCVAGGIGGQWIVVHKDGSMTYNGLGADLINELQNHESKDVKVRPRSMPCLRQNNGNSYLAVHHPLTRYGRLLFH